MSTKPTPKSGWGGGLLNDDVEYDKFAQQNNPTQDRPMGMIAEELLWLEAPFGEKVRGGRATRSTYAFAWCSISAAA